MPINWTIYKRWINSRKYTSSKAESRTSRKYEQGFITNKTESVIKRTPNKPKSRTRQLYT